MAQDRWYQTEAIQSIYDYFSQNEDGNPLVGLPTGTGKSHVIGGFIHQTMNWWPDQRFIVATHVKEIIAHNANKLLEAWPTAPLGVHSASLKQRDTMHPIIYGGIASMIKNPTAFGWRDLMLIDEAHLLSPDANTMYQRFIAQLQALNPRLRIVGFTATPYRLAHGMLTDNGLFTDMCYDLTSMEGFNRLVSEGWLARLVPKQTRMQLDVSNVAVTGGDFKKGELEDAVNQSDVTEQAIDEILAQGENRTAWLVFASGIKHAEAVAESLLARGVAAASVHSKLSGDERDERINAFKTGQLQAVVNNNVLTTGFDHPPIDLIAMLRPTVSPGLWVQMLGRGTRPSPQTGKENCLVLDFAGNTLRLGPINDPVTPRGRNKSGGEPGKAPAKVCPMCAVLMHPKIMVCENCGYQFENNVDIAGSASIMPLIRGDMPVCEWYDVDYISYHSHTKYGSPPMMKVVYYSGLNIFKEFICLEHKGYASLKARRWWRERKPWSEPPSTTYEALQLVGALRQPTAIRVWINRKYPEILTYSFDGEHIESEHTK